MKLLNLVYEKDWSIKEGELQKDEYSCVNIVFLFGDTDVIKDEKRYNEILNQITELSKMISAFLKKLEV